MAIGLVEVWTDDGETSRERPIAPPHLHHSEDEAWYVLEGALGFRVGADEVTTEAGQSVIVPGETSHSYWNAAGARTRYVIVMGPAHGGARRRDPRDGSVRSRSAPGAVRGARLGAVRLSRLQLRRTGSSASRRRARPNRQGA